MKINTKNLPPKAVVYIRVSDKKQEANNSFKTQKEYCVAYSLRNEIPITKVFQEVESAKNTKNRVVLQELMEFCLDKKNRITHFLVYHYDRFAREVFSGVGAVQQLEQAGIRVIAVQQDLPNNSTGRLMRNMAFAIAQFDNEVKSEKVTQNMMSKFNDGFWLWQCPLGYKKKYGDKEKDRSEPLLIDERYLVPFQDIFYKAGTGHYTKNQLAYVLNNDHSYTKIHGAKASSKTIDTVLLNPFYYGMMHCKSWDLKVRGNHKPMVDELTWLKAHQAIYGINRPYVKGSDERYPLKPTMLCVNCQRNVTAYAAKKGRFHYYECKNNDCDNHVLKNVDKVHEDFKLILSHLVGSDDLVKLFDYKVRYSWDLIIKRQQNEVNRLNQRLSELSSDKDKVLERRDSGDYDEFEAKSRITEINKTMNEIRLKISESEIDSYNPKLISEFIKYFFTHLAEIWWALDYSQKLAFQDRIFPVGVPHDGECFRTDLVAEMCPCISLLSHSHIENGSLVTPWRIELQLQG